MVVMNDVMAYMFGFFFGKTPLIKLSPKKTWEGFIGGAVSNIVFCQSSTAEVPNLGHVRNLKGYSRHLPV